MKAGLVWARTLAAVVCLCAVSVDAGAYRERNPAWDKVGGGRQPGKPVLAVIGLRQQKITVYDSQGPILQAPVSSGQRGFETPAGLFSVLQKNKDHVSNLYEAEMPFMQRITWSGVAMHAGPLPGYRASHGCVRLPYGFAERLFDLTSIGLRVAIAPDKAAATSVSHAQLDRLTRSGATATRVDGLDAAREQATTALEALAAVEKPAADAAKKAKRAVSDRDRAQSKLDAAVARAAAQKDPKAKLRAEAELPKLREQTSAKVAAAAAATELAQRTAQELSTAQARAREARQKAWPVSIFVSLKTQRVYVRQGFEPVLELPAVIKDPGKPIGTHAFYATEGSDGRGWMSVSLAKGAASDRVLDRIDLPEQVVKLVANSAWLGTALLVSDEAPYKETGAGTDFLVVLSGEPQGALKIRTPAEVGPVAQNGPFFAPQPVRSYRAPAQDHQFRHPLGGGF